MSCKIVETLEAKADVKNFVHYILNKFRNGQAAKNFIEIYDNEIHQLDVFPKAYRSIGIKYRGYEIRMKPFDTYNLFFVVDTADETIIILRVLKNLQNWQKIIRSDDDYHF